MSVFISSPPVGLAHPLQGWMKAITYSADHAGFNATLLPLENLQTLLLVWRSGLTHAARGGSELKLLVSHDEGASFEGLRSIYLSEEWDTRNFAGGVLGGSRVGLVAARMRGGGTKIEMTTPVFVFSDDGGATWSHKEISLPVTSPIASFHGDLVRWPAAAGGHDEFGFAAFSYNFPRKSIDGLYTRDNGETWNWRADICKSDGVIADCLTEVWVAPIAPNGPWLMTARSTTTGHARNLAVMTSKDLVTWDEPRDGGILLSGNAPALIIEGGEAYLYTVARRGHKRELPNTAGESLGNRLLVAHGPAADIVSGKADFSATGGWKEIATLPDHAVGYIFPRKMRRRWFAAFNCGETGMVGTGESKRSWLGLMTPHPPLIVDAPTLRTAMPLDNLVDNADFSNWSRGEKFSRTVSGQMTADRWSVTHPAEDAVSVEKVVAAHPLRGPRTWLRKICKAPSGKAAHSTVQAIADVGLGSDQRVTLMLRASSDGASTVSSIKLVQYFGAKGSPPVEVVLQRNVRLSNMPLLYSFSGALPSVVGKSVGLDASLRIVIEERAAAETASVNVTYGDLALVLAPVATSVRPQSADMIRAGCARYYRRLDLAALASGTGRTGTATFLAGFPPMARAPIVRMAMTAGAAGAAGSAAPAPTAENGLTSDNLVMLDLADDRMQMVALRGKPGGLLRASIELDAEWAGAKIAGPLQAEIASGKVLRSADGGNWLSLDTATALGIAVSGTAQSKSRLDAITQRLHAEQELSILDRKLFEDLLKGKPAAAAAIAERQRIIAQIEKAG